MFDRLRLLVLPYVLLLAGCGSSGEAPANPAPLDDGSLDAPADQAAICTASDAGLCPPDQFCGGGGPGLCGGGGSTSCAPVEVPLQCPYSYPPGTCGLQSDGFGSLTDCGPCPAPLSCVSSLCVWPADAGPCVPLTCQGAGYDCGQTTDGCGHPLDCGTCSGAQFCGGGGFHRCGGTCTWRDAGPCDVGGTSCTSDAGSCAEWVSCQSLDGGCGLVRGRCGGLINCGPCSGEAGAPDAAEN